jgi:hypothetical protein
MVQLEKSSMPFEIPYTGVDVTKYRIAAPCVGQ